MSIKIEISLVAKKGVKTTLPLTNSSTMTLKYIKNEDGDFVCPDCGVIKKNQNTMH